MNPNIYESESICPFLGLQEDDSTSLSIPSQRNFCHKCRPICVPSYEYQLKRCLQQSYVNCPLIKKDDIHNLPKNLIWYEKGMSSKKSFLLGFFIAIVLAAILLVVGAYVYGWRAMNREKFVNASNYTEVSETSTLYVFVTVTDTPTLTQTYTPTGTLTPSPSPSMTNTMTPTETLSPTPTLKKTKITPTNTKSSSGGGGSSQYLVPTATAIITISSTESPTVTPTIAPTEEPMATPTEVPTATPTEVPPTEVPPTEVPPTEVPSEG